MHSTRRTLLTSVGATAASAAIAGCSRLSDALGPDPEPDEPPEAGVDGVPDPGDHILGADGDWSSFGCNAANTRAVADGEAPSTALPNAGESVSPSSPIGHRSSLVVGSIIPTVGRFAFSTPRRGRSCGPSRTPRRRR